jgi:DNA-binding NarL/FixJ family response regulator
VIRVAWIDDHTMFREALTNYLPAAAPDISLESFGTLSAFRAALRSRRFDVVLLDLDLRALPDVDGLRGFELIDEACELQPDAKVAVITDFDQSDHALLAHAREHNPHGYVSKHESTNQLAADIRTLHKNGAVHSPNISPAIQALLRTKRDARMAVWGHLDDECRDLLTKIASSHHVRFKDFREEMMPGVTDKVWEKSIFPRFKRAFSDAGQMPIDGMDFQWLRLWAVRHGYGL